MTRRNAAGDRVSEVCAKDTCADLHAAMETFAQRTPIKRRQMLPPPSAGLERQPYSHCASPDHPAMLPRRAVQQFEAVGQIEIFGELNAGAARRVVDENAVDR